MHNRTRYCLGFIMMLVVLFTTPVHVVAQANSNNQDLVQLAIPVSSNEENGEANSAYIQYTLEYLQEISQYTGWEYEVVEVPGTYDEGLQNALDMVREGTVDLVAPVRYSEDMEKEIYFSQNSYTTAMAVLQIPNAIYEGGSMEDHVRVAALIGNGMQSVADEFFEKNGITAQYTMCRNVEEQIDLVMSGEADVMLNSNFECIPNMSIVAEFSPQSLYFVSGDKSLLQELDDAILYIKQANTTFWMDLYKNNVLYGSQELTLEETEFIEEAQPYTVAVLDDNAPYQYYDSEIGEYRGIAVDVLNSVAQKTGLKFKFVSVESWDKLSMLIEENKVHIVAGIPYSYEFAAERDLTITRRYASSPYVLISRQTFEGPKSGQKLALIEPSASVNERYVGDVHRFPTMGDCIEAVRSDEMDYTYVDLYTAQYYLGDSHYTELKFTPQSYTPRSVCFGLSKPTPHELLSILNKCINQFSASEMQGIITKNVNPPRDITVIDVMLDHPQEALVIIAIMGLLIASLLTFLLWRKERVSKVLRRKAMEDGLTHLYNASACRRLISQRIRQLRPDQIGVFLIMDLDHFKEINDNHGHHTGDRILQEFADLLCDILRDNSIIARIGGDEFVVYLDALKNIESIYSICERICNEAHSVCVDKKPLTISMGAVMVQSKDSYDALYNMADKALYEAKRNQRDQFCLAQRDE